MSAIGDENAGDRIFGGKRLPTIIPGLVDDENRLAGDNVEQNAPENEQMQNEDVRDTNQRNTIPVVVPPLRNANHIEIEAGNDPDHETGWYHERVFQPVVLDNRNALDLNHLQDLAQDPDLQPIIAQNAHIAAPPAERQHGHDAEPYVPASIEQTDLGNAPLDAMMPLDGLLGILDRELPPVIEPEPVNTSEPTQPAPKVGARSGSRQTTAVGKPRVDQLLAQKEALMKECADKLGRLEARQAIQEALKERGRLTRPVIRHTPGNLPREWSFEISEPSLAGTQDSQKKKRTAAKKAILSAEVKVLQAESQYADRSLVATEAAIRHAMAGEQDDSVEAELARVDPVVVPDTQRMLSKGKADMDKEAMVQVEIEVVRLRGQIEEYDTALGMLGVELPPPEQVSDEDTGVVEAGQASSGKPDAIRQQKCRANKRVRNARLNAVKRQRAVLVTALRDRKGALTEALAPDQPPAGQKRKPSTRRDDKPDKRANCLDDFDGSGSSGVILSYFRVMSDLLDMDVGEGTTPAPLLKKMFVAVSHDNGEEVRKLLTAGALPTDVYKGSTLLEHACEAGAAEAARALIDAGANPRDQLLRAAADGHGDTALLCLDRGADVNAADPSGDLPLHIAVRNDLFDLLEALIGRPDCEINATNDRNITALFSACSRGKTNALELLIKAGADLDIPSVQGYTALHVAAKDRNAAFVRMLLDGGADCTKLQGPARFSVLDIAVGQASNAEVIKMLLEAEPELRDRPCGMGTMPINTAMGLGRLESVRALLEHGVDPNLTVTAAAGGNAGELTLINFASFINHIGLLELLIEFGADVNRLNSQNISPLTLCVKQNRVDFARALLKTGADPNIQDDQGVAPVMLAAMDRQCGELARVLVEGGADYTLANREGMTAIDIAIAAANTEMLEALLGDKTGPAVMSDSNGCPRLYLHVACSNGLTDIVRLLIEHGADVNQRNDNGWSPVNSAAYNGHTEALRLVLAAGPTLDHVDATGFTPLMAVCVNNLVEHVQLLVDAGADCFIGSADGDNVLHLAANRNHVEIIKVLLDAKPDLLNMVDNFARTPLFDAAAHGHNDSVRLLLSHGADPDIASFADQTAIMAAAAFGRAESVAMLVGAGAELNQQDSDGDTALAIACIKGNAQCVRILVEAGADTTLTRSDGMTPLSCAVKNKFPDIVKILAKVAPEQECLAALLLASGDNMPEIADAILQSRVFPPDHLGQCIGLSVTLGHDMIAQSLLRAGADVNWFDPDLGESLIHAAAGGGEEELVRLLLGHGCDVNARREDGATALCIAAEDGDDEVVEMLLDAGADPKLPGPEGRLPRDIAEGHGHDECVSLVDARVKSGADVIPSDEASEATVAGPSVDDDEDQPLLITAAASGARSLLVDLISTGHDPDATNKAVTLTALVMAVSSGHAELLPLLLNAGANLKKQLTSQSGGVAQETMAMLAACAKGDAESIRLLLDAGADINGALQTGETPLLSTALYNPTFLSHVVRLPGVNLDQPAGLGAPVLLHAAGSDKIDSVRVLIQAGADINLCFPRHGTALMVAANYGHDEVLGCLLEAGADADVVDEDGDTALICAVRWGHLSCAGRLLRAGCDINTRLPNGSNAAFIAAANGFSDILGLLVAAGVETTAPGEDGKLPSEIAQTNGHQACATLLEVSGKTSARPDQVDPDVGQVESELDAVHVTHVTHVTGNVRIEELSETPPPPPRRSIAMKGAIGALAVATGVAGLIRLRQGMSRRGR
ncbi:Ankyrin repeats (3 copies) [Carpediemonas membranifera]|uniref:Ankyrin repeats (3 copies) n=1 Tax=Carpediemonas membranifera TaxID=201153 RepID=A0A8J6E6N2_9EUKA|nr:Ankyrin repeats (3 copies) [Carpediemonas membranifera]|eukprot:KAG9397312.1 Ankyrin repeats (3 copies) [Carpediemonas membranifera]